MEFFHLNNNLMLIALKRIFLLTILLGGCLFQTETLSAADLKSDVESILRLKLTPEERIDSALTRVKSHDLSNQNNDGQLECEKTMTDLVIPYATRNDCGDSKMAELIDYNALLMSRQGQPRVEDAKKEYSKALSYARKAKDHYWEGRVLDHESVIEMNYGDVSKSYQLAEQAIAAYRKSNRDADKMIVRCLYFQAVSYLQFEDLEGLAKIIGKLGEAVAKSKPENRPHALYNLYSVKEAYFSILAEKAKGKEKMAYYDSLDNCSLKSIQLIEANPDRWHSTGINIGWNYYNRASLFINRADRPNMDSVTYYCDKALDVNHYGKEDDAFEMEVSVAVSLSEAWMKNGNYGKAKEILTATLAKLDKAKDLPRLLVDKRELYNTLKQIAIESGNYQKALVYADSVASMEKQRFSDERARAVKELEIKYETQEKELTLAQSETHRNRTLMWLFAATATLLAGAILFVVYATRQRRQRQQRAMEFANLREETARQLTRQYVEGLEAERARMARELHDGVCNDLLAIQMDISRGASEEKTAALIDTCRESVRRISHELMPPEFAYATLDEVVRFFISKLAETKIGVKFTYESKAEGKEWEEVPDDTALEVYRIIQESVGNAVKHSGADSIDVSMRLTPATLTATVSDNGTYKSSSRKGLGLDSMLRRGKAINGTVEVSQSPEGGTTVGIRVGNSNK